jgi:hypothetical protein
MLTRIFWSLWFIWAVILLFKMASLPPAWSDEATGPWDNYPADKGWYTRPLPELAGRYLPADVTPEALAARAEVYPWDTPEMRDERDALLELKKANYDAELVCAALIVPGERHVVGRDGLIHHVRNVVVGSIGQIGAGLGEATGEVRIDHLGR